MQSLPDENPAAVGHLPPERTWRREWRPAAVGVDSHDQMVYPTVEQAEQIWHFFDGQVESISGGRFMATRFKDANLIVATVGQNPVIMNLFLGSTDPFRGWHCPYYDQMRPAPEVAFLQKGNGKLVFHTLLLPVVGEASFAPVFTVTADSYHIEFRQNQWDIRAPADGDWQLVGSAHD